MNFTKWRLLILAHRISDSLRTAAAWHCILSAVHSGYTSNAFPYELSTHHVICLMHGVNTCLKVNYALQSEKGVTKSNIKQWVLQWTQKEKLTSIHVNIEKRTLGSAVLFTHFMSVRCGSSDEAWGGPPQMPHSPSCPFFIISHCLHSLPFFFPVPLRCLFPCIKYYYTFCFRVCIRCIISEHLRHLNNKEWLG